MENRLIVSAVCVAVAVAYVSIRNFMSDHRSEARHREGRDRFTRAVHNAERLGFVETESQFEGAQGITDISMEKEDNYLMFYMQQSGDNIRAFLKTRNLDGNFVDHRIQAESFSKFSETLESLDHEQNKKDTC